MNEQIPFFKYQGTGNDFVIVDQFEHRWINPGDQTLIAKICDRKFGIGGDGLILLEPSKQHAFTMVYFNADGHIGSLCGNGSRCAVACMAYLKRFQESGSFEAFDGPHEAILAPNGQIEIKMANVTGIQQGKGYYELDTGSPHYITMVEDLSDLDIVEAGKAIRYSHKYATEGINVNFVEKQGDQLQVATYERGVENETLSCGTGVTAAALAYALQLKKSEGIVEIKTRGGALQVKFRKDGEGYKDIWLCGPAKLVFVGVFEG